MSNVPVPRFPVTDAGPPQEARYNGAYAALRLCLKNLRLLDFETRRAARCQGRSGVYHFVQCSGVEKALEAAPRLGSAFQYETIGFKLSNVSRRRASSLSLTPRLQAWDLCCDGMPDRLY